MIIAAAIINFFLNVLGCFAYSTRLAGLLTKRLTVAISIASIFNLLSRLLGFMLLPLLSAKIENDLVTGSVYQSLPSHYILILLMGVLGTITGVSLFRNSTSYLATCVTLYNGDRSIVYTLLFNPFSAKSSVPINIEPFKLSRQDIKYLAANSLIAVVYSTATLAAIYSSYFVPHYRVTALSMAFFLNGTAAVVFALVIDPYVSLKTDNAYAGTFSKERFAYLIKCFLYSRLMGVLVSILGFHLFIGLITKAIGIWYRHP